MTRPPKRITDPSFIYVPSAQTDLKKTFARVRREMKAAAEAEKNAPLVMDEFRNVRRGPK